MRFRAGQPGNLSEGVKLMIKITGFEHVSWASKDLEPAQSTLALFGIRPTGFEEIHSQHVTSNYYEADCGVRFEVIRPAGPDSHLNQFLTKRGSGLHHVCFQVENLEDACDQIRKSGGELVGEVFADSRGRHAFVHPKTTGGVLIGMIQLHPGLKI
jgi:methylmalonyl-CoA/ethylmalonyl-CoA epimerase